MTVISEYKVKVTDPYWKAMIEALVRAGYPRSIAETAILKTEIERSLKIAYA